MSKRKLVVANTSTWIIDQIECESGVITEDQILEWLGNAVNINVDDLYSEIRLVKSTFEIDERSPNKTTSDKAIASKYLLKLLTENEDKRKKMKIDFVASTTTATPATSTPDIQALALRVANLEKLLAQAAPTTIVKPSPESPPSSAEKPKKQVKSLQVPKSQPVSKPKRNHSDPDWNPGHDDADSESEPEAPSKSVKTARKPRSRATSPRPTANDHHDPDWVPGDDENSSQEPSTMQTVVKKIAKIPKRFSRKPKAIKVCAFNIANFGKSKFNKGPLLECIVNILFRYDLTVVQEIRSEEFDVVNNLLNELNSFCQKKGSAKRYRAERSSFVGNEHRKEQYGYFYNSQKLEIDEFRQFEDEQDIFMYEPAFANFKVKRSKKEFTIVGIHIQKDNVVKELNNLVTLYDMICDEFGTNNVIFTGDFNAEGSYLSKKRAGEVALFSDDRFTSLIGSNIDTTVSNTDCAYDRIFVAGDLFKKMEEGDGKVFRFDEEYGLTQQEAFKVSDHYPIEFKIT